jgi:hypothetical protein
VHSLLDSLRDLTEILLPDVFAYLCEHDAVQMFFAYRWMIVDFKREFDLEAVAILSIPISLSPPHLFFSACHDRPSASLFFSVGGPVSRRLAICGRPFGATTAHRPSPSSWRWRCWR